MVRIQVRGDPMVFMVDTGPEHSVVKFPTNSSAWEKKLPSSGPQALRTADNFAVLDNAGFGLRALVVHGFLYLPDCPVPLIGSDLFAKMGTWNFFSADRPAKAGRTTILLDYDSLYGEKRKMSVFLHSRIRTIPPKLETGNPLA